MTTPQRVKAAARPEPADEESGFLDQLRARAEAAPDAQVLFAPGRASITFTELSDRIGAVADALTDAGISRDDVVAVVMADGPDLLSIILGAGSVAICAPVNPTLRKAEMESCLRDLGARALIVDRMFHSLAGEVAAELGILVLSAEGVLGVRESVKWVEHCRPSDVALVLQTSATTGKSRLVPLTHSNLRAMASNTRETLQLTAEDRFVSMMPLFHLQGLLSSIAQLLAGGGVISTSGFESSTFVNWIETFRPTWYTAVPALHNAILPLLEAQPDVLDRAPLRFVRSIGAPLPQALLANIERVLRVPVLEGYGMTEAGMVTSTALPPQERKSGSVGKSAGVEVAIKGDGGEFLSAGRAGEIAVRGPEVIRGYRNNAEADRTAFKDGWLLTGDLGYLDAEGFLFVTGRIKDIINRGGEKVLPAEIDEALSAHPSVLEAVAFGVPHPTLGEDVVAAVVLAPGASVGEAELRRFAAARLADFKMPRRIIFLDAIAKGATGKAQRAELSKRFEAEVRLDTKSDETLTLVEKKLEDIWTRILRIKTVGVHDDFFNCGGDSLALTLLMAEIEFEFGTDAAVDAPEFFATPTIRTLADLIAAHTPSSNKGQRSSFVALQPLGSRIPFFCIPGADENPYHFTDLAKSLGQDQPFYALRDPRTFEERGIYTLEQHAEQFTAAIRSLRPHGPYFLGGHCYGGILAFETARQLVASGEEVGLLALFEVPTPGYPKIVRHWRTYLDQSRRLIRAAARGENHATWIEVRSHIGFLTRLLKKKKLVLSERGLVATGQKSVDEPTQRLDHLNLRAGRTYEPKQLRCKVVQFVSTDERHSTMVLDDPLLGWRDYVGAGFSVQKVPGKASVLFKKPNVDAVASQLRSLLDRLDTSSQSGDS